VIDRDIVINISTHLNIKQTITECAPVDDKGVVYQRAISCNAD